MKTRKDQTKTPTPGSLVPVCLTQYFRLKHSARSTIQDMQAERAKLLAEKERVMAHIAVLDAGIELIDRLLSNDKLRHGGEL